MEVDCTLLLPEEVLELVFLQRVLSVSDLFRVAGTCRRFRVVVDRLWSKIARKRWSNWGSLVEGANVDWKDMCRKRFCVEWWLSSAVEDLSARMVTVEHVSDHTLAVLMEGSAAGLDTAVLEEVMWQAVVQEHTTADLTLQHYAVYLFEYVKQRTVVQAMKEYHSLPLDQMDLETGAALFAMYIDPYGDHTVEEVHRELDRLAETVAEHVVRSSTAVEGVGQAPFLLRARGLVDHQQMCHHISEVLFVQLGFIGNTQDYHQLSNSLIHEVLRRKLGIPITLCIIYSAVARRLGVHLEPVSFPQNFLLRLRRQPQAGTAMSEDFSPASDPNIYINPFDAGALLSAVEALQIIGGPRVLRCPELSSFFDTARPTDVLMRMAANVVNTSQLQLQLGQSYYQRHYLQEERRWSSLPGYGTLNFLLDVPLIVPAHQEYNRQYVWSAMNTCVRHHFEIEKVREVVEHLQEADTLNIDPSQIVLNVEPLAVRRRDPSVLYNVGMIYFHKNYKYYGVISGWDAHCCMPLQWINQMRVFQLTHGANQPFYSTLVGDGTTRYVAQENVVPLRAEECRPILHWAVGRFFQRFSGDHYEPNAALRAAYPEDQYCLQVESVEGAHSAN